MEIIDLTNILTQKVKTYPTGPDASPTTAPRVEVIGDASLPSKSTVGSPWRMMEAKYLSKVSTSGYNWMHYVLDSHAGTHVDAPYHFVDDGLRIDEVPLDRFVNLAIVINTKDRLLKPEDILAERERIHGKILLLYTGWPEKKNFGSDDYFFGFPTFGPEIGEAILEVGALAVGLDTPSIDALDSHFDNHRILLPQNVVLIENLRNLHLLLEQEEFLFCAAPLKIKGGDASPVRAYALLK